jgi:hypothetical protein
VDRLGRTSRRRKGEVLEDVRLLNLPGNVRNHFDHYVEDDAAGTTTEALAYVWRARKPPFSALVLTCWEPDHPDRADNKQDLLH